MFGVIVFLLYRYLNRLLNLINNMLVFKMLVLDIIGEDKYW